MSLSKPILAQNPIKETSFFCVYLKQNAKFVQIALHWGKYDYGTDLFRYPGEITGVIQEHTFVNTSYLLTT